MIAMAIVKWEVYCFPFLAKSLTLETVLSSQKRHYGLMHRWLVCKQCFQYAGQNGPKTFINPLHKAQKSS